MAIKKIPIGFNEPEAELETRVDAMMDTERSELKNPDFSAPPTTAPTVAPIDIFNDPKTAPEVPAGLLDKINQSSGPEPKVPQLIASTAPKKSTFIAAQTNNVPPKPEVEELGANDAAPQFNDNQDTATSEVIVPPLRIDDAKSDAAIAAIVAHDSDELLAAQDGKEGKRQSSDRPTFAPTVKTRKRLFKRPLFYIILFLLLLLVAAAIPFSRYKLAGLVLKQDFQLKVVDSKTNRPVSKAAITIDGKSAITNAAGLADLKIPVGPHKLLVTKQYYASYTTTALVNFKKSPALAINLVATGRQVPIVITNKITGKPLAGAEISVLSTNAKTDSQGRAVVVLPTNIKTVSGRLSLAGYNNNLVTVEITDSLIAANSFTLTPTGKIYFLSNEQGTTDVVKTNLDGSDRQTVLKGSGKEDPNTTVLLSSRDWHYSVLKAQRDNSQAAMYLIDSSTDKLIEFDSGDANFTPIGWSGHNFIYDVVRNNVATSQNAHEVIKSYNADRGELNQLDQNQADSNGSGNPYAYQSFYNFYMVDNIITYVVQWYASGNADLSTKNAIIRGVQADGSNKKDYQTIPAAGLGYVRAAQVSPQKIYYSASNFDNNTTTYYEYQDQAVKISPDVNQASFNKQYPSYVLSPSGKQVAWSETRDGKSVVLLGDSAASGGHVLANLSGYSAFGWQSEDYLLVTKKNSEIYIVSNSGNNAPIKVTDYYKPSRETYDNGYGGL